MEENTEEKKLINLTIKLSGNTFKIRVDANSSLEEFKDILSVKISVPSENISLILNGRSLVHEELTLVELGVKDDNTIFLTVSRKDYIPTSVPLEPVGSSPEEKMMEQMMENPIYSSMFNNPDLIKGIMESSPQFKKILDSNPELRHVMNDPAAMNEMMRTMRNPSLRREMMRNTDRMMSNIESMPGGHDALRRMYHSIQEPMENALDEMQSEQAPLSSSSSNNRNDGTANTSALPNPWAAPSAAQSNPLGGLGGGMGMNMFNNPGLMNGLLGGQNNNMFGGQNMAEMMNNPMVQSILNNPQMMNQIFSSMAGGQNGTGGATPNLFGSPNMFGTNNNAFGGNNMFGGGGLNGNNNMFGGGGMNPALLNQLFGGSTAGQTPNTATNPLMFNPALMNQLLGLQNPNGMSTPLNSTNGTAFPNIFNGSLFGNQSSTSNIQTSTTPLSNSNSSQSTQTNSLSTSNQSSNSTSNTNNSIQTPQPQANNVEGQQASEQRYSVQITQLNEMGFSDNAKNLQALQQTQGNVERALELLFSL